MRAQLTKNAVIVPAGAKGGFYLKTPADRDELKAEVERHYVTFIRSLLSVTDNLVDGEVVHPPRRARARRRRHLPRRRRRQGHGDVLGHRQPRLAGVRLLARRRVRLRRLGGLRPQGARDHRQGRVGVGQAPLQGARRRHPGRRVHRRRHRRHVRRRVRQRDAAVASTSGSSPPTTTGTSSSTRTRTPRPASPSASGCSSSPARPGTTTTAS